MREIEAVIEQIQSMLAWEHDPEQEYMETLVADYSRSVSAANERLRQCEALLSKGLRTEAIQQCETEPNLLDLTAILDFPEVEYWTDYVSQYELPPLPVLLLEVAVDLNDAYATAQPVAGLLKQHRLHALALSPLSVRIQILRELASKDKSNPLWLDDLANYEVARHIQIESEQETVLSDRNTTQAAALEAELASPKWRTRPPKDLVRKVQTVRARLQTYDARRELRTLADQLNQAFADRDLDMAHHHAERWDSLVETAAVPEGDPVFEVAEAALEWIAEENQRTLQEGAYQSSVSALKRNLDRDSSVEDLNRLADAITMFDKGIPDELAQRLEDRKTKINLKSSRRSMVIYASIGAVALIVGSILVSMLFRYWHAEAVTENQQAMRQLLTAANINGAREFYDQLDTDMATSPELLILHQQLKDAEIGEKTRRSSFLSLLKKVEAGIAQSPDQNVLDKSLADLDRAEDLTVDAAEKDEVQRVRNAVTTAMELAKAAADQQFLEDLDAARNRYHQRPDNDMAVNQLLTDEFRALNSRLHVTESHKKPIAAILRTLDKARAEHQRKKKVTTDLGRITAAVGDLDRFQSQLRQYVRSHSGTGRSASFQRVIASEAGFWTGPRLWNELRDSWMSLSLTDVTPASASALRQQYIDFMKSSKRFSAGHDLADQAEALQAVIARDGNGDSPLPERLREPLEFYLQLPLMVARGDVRYYSNADEPPIEKGDTITIVPFKDDLLRRSRQKDLSVNEVTNRRSGGKFVWDAPHAIFAQSALEELKVADQHWEEIFGRMVTQLVSDTGIDPIVRITLLYNLLETGSEGSVFFRDAFRTHVAAVDKFDEFEANWISPTGAPSARVSAALILDDMSPLDEASKAAIATRDAVAAKKPGPAYRWVGWIYEEADETWNCATGTPLQPAANGSLVVIVPQDNKERPSEIVRIGSVASGQLQLAPAGNPTGFLEGRPVYLAEE